ncbi:ferritin-like domain-containing protein [Mycena rosella]|uniref:Ferritin-like domain-containing protein n=1 Tax=Mycena rosella TaxID=1033263 RepID=A0AAD7G3S0_MYCRO|nr:ferritin-like domain-containing protein [Mycena rosella]
MKYPVIVSILAAFAATQVANALPTKRDITEQLETEFYTRGLEKFLEADFIAAGYPEWTHGRFTQIRDHEQAHVTFLTTALETAGSKAVQVCEYQFAWDRLYLLSAPAVACFYSPTPEAYVGGSELISSKEYLMAAASILAVEARHVAWVNAAVKQSNPWDSAFQTPLAPSPMYALAAGFIKSCPASNAALLPALNVYPGLSLGDAHIGTTTTVKFAAPKPTSQLFVAFLSGPGAPVFVPIQAGNQVAVPGTLRGLVFAFVTRDGGKVDDSTIVAGPALLDVAYDSRGQISARLVCLVLPVKTQPTIYAPASRSSG